MLRKRSTCGMEWNGAIYFILWIGLVLERILFHGLSCFIFPHWLQLGQTKFNPINFRLYRSTRQGCPLSPLLFALAIEPLSITLRSNSAITGIVRNCVELKVSLYADDLLLYVSNLSVSIPAALATFQSFGQISGYKLNLSKSVIFPINALA